MAPAFLAAANTRGGGEGAAAGVPCGHDVAASWQVGVRRGTRLADETTRRACAVPHRWAAGNRPPRAGTGSAGRLSLVRLVGSYLLPVFFMSATALLRSSK